MKKLDLSEKHSKSAIPPGTTILIQGETCRSLIIIESGMVEALHTSQLSDGDSDEEILGKSLRFGLIKGDAVIGLGGLFNEDSVSLRSFRTVSECLVTALPQDEASMQVYLQENKALNLRVLRSMCSRIESALYLYTNYKYLWHKYASIADTIALGIPSDTIYSEQRITRESGSLFEYSGFLKSELEEDRRPAPWEYNLFLGTIQDQLNLYEEQDRIRLEDLFDYKQFLFIKRILSKPDKILNALFEKDEPTNNYIFTFLKQTIATITEASIAISGSIHDLIEKVFSDEGWAVSALRIPDREELRKNNFMHFLSKFSWRCRKDTQILLGRDIFRDYKIFSVLKKYTSFQEPREDSVSGAAAPSAESEEKAKRLKKYKGLLRRILDFSPLDDSFRNEFTESMEIFLARENQFENIPELNALREKLGKMYWQLYESCFLKVIDSDLKGFIPGIMLHFGVVDERLLTEKELLEIDRLYAGTLFVDYEIPVMTLPYFLEKIYKGEVSPSMTGMGDLFSTLLQAQKKLTPREKKAAYIYEDTPEDRVRFELRKIAGDISTVLNGNRVKTLPFLCSQILSGSISRLFLDPDRIAQSVLFCKSRDFSLFYREVLFKHDLGADFIKKEIIPNFILYPVFGTRSVMWQEMEGNSKQTPGRLFFPCLFAEKIEENLLYQLAKYRWELQKTIAGYNWTDPVEGGLVGVYYDYIRYYRKNPNITLEAKKRLEEFIKKTKSDDDRFARDYISWVQFEYEGKIRLNSFAREIFYRFCPFPLKKRNEMALKPDFKILENRYQNRQQKEILKLKSRLIKFEKKSRSVPEELSEYGKFLEY